MTDSYVDMHTKNTFYRTCSRLCPPACLYLDVNVCAWVCVCVCVCVCVRVFLWHDWKSHATRIDEVCRTYGWVMSHIWMSHVTYMNESHHTYTHPGVKMRENSHEIYQGYIDELHMSHISMDWWIACEWYLDESMNYTSVMMNCICVYRWIALDTYQGYIKDSHMSHILMNQWIAWESYIYKLHMRVSRNCIWVMYWWINELHNWRIAHVCIDELNKILIKGTSRNRIWVTYWWIDELHKLLY